MSFAKFNVETQIFYRSAQSYALVNLKPIVPGHVLVIPKRVVPRLADLSGSEISDLFLAVQRVAGILSTAFKAEATTLSIQDGPSAGQSVPHLHVHILPRKAGDLPQNDEVYAALDRDSARLEQDWRHALATRPPFTAVDDDARQPRTMAEMEEEAQWLATFF